MNDLRLADHAGILAAERAAREDGVTILVGASGMVAWLVAALGLERVRPEAAR